MPGLQPSRRLSVRIPMMPKGVEHKSTQKDNPLAERENSDDAERR